MLSFHHELDARGDKCPSPVMKTKNILKNMLSGEVLHVMASDPTSEQDIETLLQAMQDKMIDTHFSDGIYHFYIKKS